MKAENQKKFYVYVLSLLVMALCWGCKDDDENSLPPEPVDKEEEEFVHLDLDYLDFSAEGGTEEIDFSTSSDWEAVSLASWIKVSPSTGEKGEDVGLQLQVEENEDSAGREAKLILRIASGNTADTLTVRQAGRTRYVPVSWDEDAKLTRFDLMNGDVGIEFRGDVPVFTPGVSAIVVPTDTMSYIRVVKDISAEGSSVTLKTEEGSLTDIFMDQEFTLSITPNPNARMTRSGKLNTTDANGVIHPDKIIACMKDGSRVTLYDA
ncbi:MAG: BACON domain-containing protein [Bacteroides sp.]|nr:BACON domain-containing protein [Bacteroides sp.]